ncbi:MAG: antibiotic biosynthesis monooxygenase [Gaiellaceae bacterium]
MFVRTSTYDLPEDGRAEAVPAFRDAFAQIGECEGFRGGYFLVSCDGERAITFTLWESRAAMEASRVKASRLRSEAAREGDGGVVSVEEFEVAVDASVASSAAVPPSY